MTAYYNIPDLPGGAVVTLAGSDLLEVYQGGINKFATAEQLRSYGLTANQILFANGSAIVDGSANFLWNDGTNTFHVGTASAAITQFGVGAVIPFVGQEGAGDAQVHIIGAGDVVGSANQTLWYVNNTITVVPASNEFLAIEGEAKSNHTVGTIADQVGVEGNAYALGGNVTRQAGVEAWVLRSGPGTTAEASAVRAWTPQFTGGAVTLNAGVFIMEQAGSGAGSDYQVYSPGTAPSYFNGNVGIGTATAAYPLQISGNHATNWQALDVHNSSAAGYATMGLSNNSTGYVLLGQAGSASVDPLYGGSYLEAKAQLTLLTDTVAPIIFAPNNVESGRFTTTAGAFSLGVAGTTLGVLQLAGNTSGTISIKPQAAAGTFNFNLPITAGAAGQALVSGGGGGAAMTWGLGAFSANADAPVTGYVTVVDSGGTSRKLAVIA